MSRREYSAEMETERMELTTKTAEEQGKTAEAQELRPLPPFAQRLYENGYFRQVETTFADCDRNKRLRVASLLSILAAFGGYDYDARGLTHEKLSELRTVFLLSRAAIRIFRMPVYREVLDIRTWEDGPHGAHFRRVFELRRRDGELCAAAKTDWILVDPVSRKILRPASFTARTPGLCPVEIDCPEPKKIRLPKEDGVSLGTRRVVWSDLDGNGHLYSGNYGDIVWDYLPPELRERPVSEFTINYHKEAALDEELSLVGWWTEDGFLMEGQGRSGPCFAAACVFAEDGGSAEDGVFAEDGGSASAEDGGSAEDGVFAEDGGSASAEDGGFAPGEKEGLQ